MVELLEARKPRGTATMSEVNGVVKIGEIVRRYCKVAVIGDDGERRECLPRSVHIHVRMASAKRGDPSVDKPRNPHDVLAVLGEKELQDYLTVHRRIQSIASSRLVVSALCTCV